MSILYQNIKVARGSAQAVFVATSSGASEIQLFQGIKSDLELCNNNHLEETFFFNASSEETPYFPNDDGHHARTSWNITIQAEIQDILQATKSVKVLKIYKHW